MISVWFIGAVALLTSQDVVQPLKGEATPSATPSPALPSAADSTAVAPVSIVAPTKDVALHVDRRSYDIRGDVNYQTGSILDVIEALPSVIIDPQGGIRVGSNGSAVIFIDGKPATAVAALGAVTALQQMRATRFSRAEIITNPPASFSVSANTGIINLISERPKSGTREGTLTVGANSRDGRDLAFTASIAEEKNAFTFDGSLKRSRPTLSQEAAASFLDTTGARSQTASASDRSGDRENRAVTLSYNYTPTADTTVASSVSLFEMTRRQVDRLTYDDLNQGVDAGFSQRSQLRSRITIPTFSTSLDVARPESGRKLSLSGEYSFSRSNTNRVDDISYNDGSLSDVSRADRYRDDKVNLQLDYSIGQSTDKQLSVGAQLEWYGSDTVNYLQQTGSGAGDRETYSRFHFGEVAYSAYVELQRAVGKWDLEPGVRVERAEVSAEDSAASAARAYVDVFPTLHLQRQFGDEMVLSASYSRRTDRPTAGDLNAFRKEDSPRSISQGNPSIRREITHAVELQLERTSGERNYLTSSLFYKRTENAIGDVVQDIGDGVLLHTRANLGTRERAGFEINAKHQFTKSLNADTYALVEHVSAPGSSTYGVAPWRGTSWYWKINSNWSPTQRDLFRLSYNLYSSEQISQTTLSSFSVVNIGYRRKVKDNIYMLISANDLFNDAKYSTKLTTPTYQSLTASNFDSRRVAISITYQFGGRSRAAPERFDFSSGRGG